MADSKEFCAGDRNDKHLGEKKAIVTGNLQKRDEERLADVQRRKDEKETTSASNEKIGFFEENFARAIKEVEDGLTGAVTLEKSKLADYFDNLALSLQRSQKFLNDSTFFLPAYQVQRAKETLAKLNTAIQDSRGELLPKKKFAFRTKKKTTEKAKIEKPPTDVVDAKVLNVELTDIRFTDRDGETLAKTAEEIKSGDVALARLKDCTVTLFGSPSTLHVNNLKNCTILCGPVSSSIFVDDCTDCTFVAPCQQLRVHSTTNSTFYLHVTSRAIIEDSNSLKFAPYNLDYKGLDEHYEFSGLDKSRNSWNDVDDFNWLASDAHSPNWMILEEDKRTTNWNI